MKNTRGGVFDDQRAVSSEHHPSGGLELPRERVQPGQLRSCLVLSALDEHVGLHEQVSSHLLSDVISPVSSCRLVWVFENCSENQTGQISQFYGTVSAPAKSLAPSASGRASPSKSNGGSPSSQVASLANSVWPAAVRK